MQERTFELPERRLEVVEAERPTTGADTAFRPVPVELVTAD